LVKTSLNDSQVMYWEPAKYVAKLRTLKTDVNPLLLKINMGAGHGGASGRYDYLREIALDYVLLLTQLAIRDGERTPNVSDPSAPLMQQYHAIKSRYQHALLLFRLGDFYELFYEDAMLASRELQITLTS